MTPFSFIRVARWMIYLGLLYFVGVLVILLFLAGEIRKEVSFYKQYGEHWKENYEKYWGSLSQAHVKMAVAISSLVLVCRIMVWSFTQADSTKFQTSRLRSLSHSCTI